MSFLRAIASGLRSLFRKEQVDRELDEELHAYQEMAIDEKIKQGMSREEAVRAVRLERGSREVTKEVVRDARWESFLERCWQDLNFGLRMLRKSPGFTSVAVLSLALGIGANTAIFTLTNALLLRRLPVPSPQQLVRLSPSRPDGTVLFSFPMFREVEHGQRVFSGLIGWSPGSVVNVEVNGTVAQDNVQAITGNYYSVLGVRPFLGRLITPQDADPSSGSPSQVAVLGYEFWQRLGASSDLVGKQIRIEGQPFTIIGVTRRWFTGMSPGEPPEIIIPLTAEALIQGNNNILQGIEDRSILWLYVAGRLKEHVSIAQARAQLLSFWPGVLQATAPTQTPGNRLERWLSMKLDVTSAATGIAPDLRDQFTRPLYVLIGIVGLILLVACVNLASLMLARTVARSQEMSVRVALGAKPWALARQVLIESLTLSFAGALLGLAIAYWGSNFLVSVMTHYYLAPVVIDLRPDLRIMGITVSVAILTGILFGFAPAVRASRGDPVSVLQQNSRRVAGGAGKLSKTLIVVQIALSFVLLLGAGLLVRTFQKLYSLDLGFERENLLQITLTPRPSGYRNLDMNTYHRQLAERVSAIPGVHLVSFSDSNIPAQEGWRDMVSVLQANSSAGAGPMVDAAFVAPGFLQTLGIRLVDGRDFDWNDEDRHPSVAIINSNLAERLFPKGHAIGQRVRFGVIPDFQSLEIVGVVDNARVFDLRDSTECVLYFPSLQHPKWAQWSNLFIRTSAAPAALSPAVTQEVESLGHEYVLRTRSIAQVTDELFVTERATAALSALFAGLALLLACVGLYGLMSYTVTRRTNEIGIRTALGAQRKNILWMVLREAIELALLGVVLGIPCSLAANRLIASMLFGVSSGDFPTILAVSLLLFTMALLAAYFPGRRASAIDPMIALRYE
jgi:predicted permease